MKKANRKKLPTFAKTIIAIGFVIGIIGIGSYTYVSVKLNRIKAPEVVQSVQPEEEYFEIDETKAEGEVSEVDEAEKTHKEISYKDIVWPEDGGLLRDKDIVNILLIGQDRQPGKSRSRSDTIMLATINKKDKTIKITSIMRDLYVQIPGYSDNRINAAYQFGGMALLDLTIEKNFEISIDGNIEVDFNGFKQVIDSIGGIEIEVNAAEVGYLEGRGFEGLTEGKILMNGSLALTYAQIRRVGNSDYERTERQRRLMTTVFNKLKGSGITEILRLTDVIFPIVTTDLENAQMIGLATSVALMGVNEVETYRIPRDGAFESAKVRGMAVLVPDLSKNRSALREIIYGDKDIMN